MKLCCTIAVVFICLFSLALFLFFTSIDDDQKTIEEPHYMCPAGYELLTELNPPKCRHYIQKAIGKLYFFFCFSHEPFPQLTVISSHDFKKGRTKKITFIPIEMKSNNKK